MEGGAELRLQPGLDAVVAVPDHPLEEGVDKGHDQHSGAQLRTELGALGDTTGNNRRDGRRKSQQKEELHQPAPSRRRAG